jgi:hypothetical protein
MPKFFDWEYRPAVSEGSRAWAVLAPGEDWTEVDVAEVVDSGKVLPDEAAWRQAFSLTFPDLPDLPRRESE